jgi:hypothetical protein
MLPWLLVVEEFGCLNQYYHVLSYERSQVWSETPMLRFLGVNNSDGNKDTRGKARALKTKAST